MNAGALGLPMPGLLVDLGTKQLNTLAYVDWQLPANWRRLTITCRNVSSTVNFALAARLGVSNAVAALNYEGGWSSLVNASSVGTANEITAFILGTGNAGESCHSISTITRTGVGKASCMSVAFRVAVAIGNTYAGAAPALPSDPTVLRILPSAGVFDAGEINVMADLAGPLP